MEHGLRLGTSMVIPEGAYKGNIAGHSTGTAGGRNKRNAAGDGAWDRTGHITRTAGWCQGRNIAESGSWSQAGYVTRAHGGHLRRKIYVGVAWP
jgi:hypothetical protein